MVTVGEKYNYLRQTIFDNLVSVRSQFVCFGLKSYRNLVADSLYSAISCKKNEIKTKSLLVLSTSWTLLTCDLLLSLHQQTACNSPHKLFNHSDFSHTYHLFKQHVFTLWCCSLGCRCDTALYEKHSPKRHLLLQPSECD